MQMRYAQAARQAAPGGNGGSMPEIRVIAPGRTYRVDSDATHSPMFHQCEGLWIGENVSFKDLKVVFTDFLPHLLRTRRPGAALPAKSSSLSPSPGPRSTSSSSGPLAGRWLEVAGSGQVHPNVVRNMGLDPGDVHRLRLRHGPRPADHAALRRERPAPVLRRRYPFPAQFR